MDLFGRRVIYTSEEVIDASNVVAVLEAALVTHSQNSTEVKYLYDYYKGKQPILEREKEIRPEINEKMVVNKANAIVDFKVGYLLGEPLQYVCRSGDDKVSEAIKRLNEYVFAEDKAAKDEELARWFSICGTSYRMVLPDADGTKDESPFEIFVLDPRSTFVVYSTGLGNKPVMGVTYVKRGEQLVYSVYTDRKYFEIVATGDSYAITVEAGHILGEVPIVEYPCNDARLGEFEKVLGLLDCLNLTESDRVNAVEGFVQALMVFKGVDIEDPDYKNLRQEGAIKVPVDGDIKYLVQELNQSQSQTQVDDLYQNILSIVGMPSMSDGSTSDSSNNGAVILKNGWELAEARAKAVEKIFDKSEKRFLRIVLRITNTLRDMNLRLADIDIRFTRRNYENIQTKAQVLTTMLASGKIHPRLAFASCGLFADPESAYLESERYVAEQERKQEEELAAVTSAPARRADEAADTEPDEETLP